jgi:hypothetical protein
MPPNALIGRSYSVDEKTEQQLEKALQQQLGETGEL